MEVAANNRRRANVNYLMRDQYMYFCKNKSKDIKYIKEDVYRKIINTLSEKMWAKLMRTGLLSLGFGIGELEIVKKRTKTYVLKDGSISVNFPISFNATMRLYEEDEDAKRRHIKVRKLDNDFSYRIRFRPNKSMLNNRMYLSFKPFESKRRQFSQDIIDNKIDALLYEK